VFLAEFITWAPVIPEVARAPNRQSISGLFEKVTYSQAVKLVDKYGEDCMQNVVCLDCI